jgi:hypothetical protein
MLVNPIIEYRSSDLRYSIGLSLLLLVFVTSCTLWLETGETSTTVKDPTVTSQRPTTEFTPVPSLPSEAAPSVTPNPTLGPEDVADVVKAAQVSLEQRNVDPICLRWEDTDQDGDREWVGVYLRPGDPSRLEGFVLDGQTWHGLRAGEAERYGLGEYPTCELDVNDTNVDGKVEVTIWGHAETSIDLLHIFAWSGSGYDEIASFQGDAGLELADVNNDLIQEIIVRHNAGDGLAWETIHRWDGTNYVWNWERYRWLHADYPHAYLSNAPTHSVISFYLALDDRDLHGAYELLSTEARATQPYETWAGGFDTTLGVEVGSVLEVERAESRATVTAQVRSYDNIDGYIIGQLWDITWSVVREDDVWLLDSARQEALSHWEAPYFQ